MNVSSSFLSLLLLVSFCSTSPFVPPSLPIAGRSRTRSVLQAGKKYQSSWIQRTLGIDVLVEGQKTLQEEMKTLQEGQKDLQVEFKGLKEGQKVLKVEMKDLKVEMKDLQVELKDLKEKVDRIDLRTGYVVENDIRSKIGGDRIVIKTVVDVVVLLNPKGENDRCAWADAINDHLYRNCTRYLVHKIAGRDFTVPDGKPWERLAYQELQKAQKKINGNGGENSGEAKVVRAFLNLLADGASKEWLMFKKEDGRKKKKEPKGKFNHIAAKRHLNEATGLVASLIFADPLLEPWNYLDEKKWAVDEVEIDCALPRDPFGKIRLVEIKSSKAGAKKGKDQLFFRAHLFDEYANLAWSDRKYENETLSMVLEKRTFDRPTGDFAEQPNLHELLNTTERGFTKASRIEYSVN